MGASTALLTAGPSGGRLALERSKRRSLPEFGAGGYVYCSLPGGRGRCEGRCDWRVREVRGAGKRSSSGVGSCAGGAARGEWFFFFLWRRERLFGSQNF